MAKVRSPDREKAEKLYLQAKGNIKLIEIANTLGVSDGTVRGWKNKDKWDEKLNGTFQKKNEKDTERSKRKKGGQLGNKNALGHGAPVGNLNAIKHGAYQSIYADMLSEEEQLLYEKITATIDIDEEIRLLRLKIARLLTRSNSHFYNQFGERIEKEVSEEDRENGILACMDQLRKLIETKSNIFGDTEKLQLEKEKFEFSKYKTEIELQLKKEKLSLDKLKVGDGEDETEDDGFIEALEGKVEEVWDDEES